MWVPGWSFDQTFWAPLIQLFPEDKHVVLEHQDLLSSSEKIPLEGQNWIENQDWIVIGHSLGFMLALKHLPLGQIKAFVSLAGVTRFCASDDFLAGIPLAALQDIREQCHRDPQGFITGFRRHCGLSQSSNQQLHAWDVQNKDVLLQGLEHLISHDARAVLSQAQRPTLVLMTDDDAITPPPLIEGLYHDLALVTLAKYTPDQHDKAGHAFPFTHPQWCFNEISQFLTQIESL